MPTGILAEEENHRYRAVIVAEDQEQVDALDTMEGLAVVRACPHLHVGPSRRAYRCLRRLLNTYDSEEG